MLFCESYECVAKETTTRHTHTLFAYTHCFLFAFYLLGCAQLAYSPSYCYSLSAFVHYTTRMSIQMLANLYKRLTITTNALPMIRMACDCFRICCKYVLFIPRPKGSGEIAMSLAFVRPSVHPSVNIFLSAL